LVTSKEFHHSGFSGADPRDAGWNVVLNSALALDNLSGTAPPQNGVMERLLVLCGGGGSSYRS